MINEIVRIRALKEYVGTLLTQANRIIEENPGVTGYAAAKGHLEGGLHCIALDCRMWMREFHDQPTFTVDQLRELFEKEMSDEVCAGHLRRAGFRVEVRNAA